MVGFWAVGANGKVYLAQRSFSAEVANVVKDKASHVNATNAGHAHDRSLQQTNNRKYVQEKARRLSCMDSIPITQCWEIMHCPSSTIR